MLVIGSTALRYHNVILPRQKRSDLDIIGMEAECENYIEANIALISRIEPSRRGKTIFIKHGMPVEFEIAKPDSSAAKLIEFCETDTNEFSYPYFYYAHPDVILALKMSHRYLRNSPHFKKTMDDIIALRNRGYIVPPALEGDWMKQRMKETYYYAHPSLAQSKENFFKDDNVAYKYDHDTIHKAIRLFARPAFEYIKKDAAEVYCSKDKFYDVSEAIRLATVLEESYVLALERHQIPNNFEPDPRKSFEIALKKVCTSIASGWWRAYAYDHYYDVLALYDERYVERFKTALVQGVIKPYALSTVPTSTLT